MGYTTRFIGSVKLSRKLTIKEAMHWMNLYEDDSRFKNESGIGTYLQWIPSNTLDAIVWDQEEKFYFYSESLEWICRWLSSIGVSANGSFFFRGENYDDIGNIFVKDNIVTIKPISVDIGEDQTPLTMKALGEMAIQKLLGEES